MTEPSFILRSRGGFRAYQGYTKATAVEVPDVMHDGTSRMVMCPNKPLMVSKI